MTKAECIYQFWNSFGIPAYEEHSVPTWTDDAQTEEIRPPYITYQLALDSFRGRSVAVTADIWDCSEAWDYVNAKADEIAAAIGSFKRLLCDEGYILVTKGSPFAQNYADGIYKRNYLNLYFTFITN